MADLLFQLLTGGQQGKQIFQLVQGFKLSIIAIIIFHVLDNAQQRRNGQQLLHGEHGSDGCPVYIVAGIFDFGKRRTPVAQHHIKRFTGDTKCSFYLVDSLVGNQGGCPLFCSLADTVSLEYFQYFRVLQYLQTSFVHLIAIQLLV